MGIRLSEKALSREELKDLLYRRRYAIPNAVTVGNMFCGFLAIMYSSTGRFEKASIAVLIAILLDGLDGRVARRLNATSKFGIEFDSLSDLVSFGVAPAVMVYHWAFHRLAPDFGIAITFFYALCAASRLARFNISTENLKNFTGLPTPGAAIFVVSVVHAVPYEQNSYLMTIAGALSMLTIGILMVSSIEFFSIKQFKLSGVKVRWHIALGLLIALAWYDPRLGLLTIASGYAMSGPFTKARRRLPTWLGGSQSGKYADSMPAKIA